MVVPVSPITCSHYRISETEPWRPKRVRETPVQNSIHPSAVQLYIEGQLTVFRIDPPGSRHHHKERTRNVAPQVSPPPWPLWENTNTTTTTTTTQQTPGLDINYSIEVVDEGEPTTTPTTRLAFDHAGSFPFVAGHTASNNTNDHDFADWFVEEFGTDPSTAYLRVENWDPLGQSGLA